MNQRPDNPKDIPDDEAILAWLDGELGGREAESFSARVQADPELRSRVERTREALAASRDWMMTDPPGAARVDALPIPRVGAPGRVVELAALSGGAPARRGRVWLARGLAAAAIFAVGFLAGQLNMKRSGEQIAVRPPIQLPRPAATPTPSVTAMPAAAKDNPPAERVVAQVSPSRGWAQPTASPAPAAREEGGRVIVETTLAGSGGRALWVVDGGFDVAANTIERKGK